VTLRVRIRRRGQNSAIGWLTDVSLSGAYVQTSAPLSLVSRIHVAVDQRGTGNLALRSLRLRGRIVRHGPGGVGVEWEEFASEILSRMACRKMLCIAP
jgi:PilZ domain